MYTPHQAGVTPATNKENLTQDYTEHSEKIVSGLKEWRYDKIVMMERGI